MNTNQKLILGAFSYIAFTIITLHPFIYFEKTSLTMNAVEITNVLTALVALATLWLGIETRKMAKIAKQSISLETMPYLSFRGFHINFMKFQGQINQPDQIRLALNLYNPGKVMVKYSVDKFEISQNNFTLQEAVFNTSGGVIHPSETMLFFYNSLESKNKISFPISLRVSYQISYWAIPAEKKMLTAVLDLTLFNESNNEWIYIDGPNYS